MHDRTAHIQKVAGGALGSATGMWKTCGQALGLRVTACGPSLECRRAGVASSSCSSCPPALPLAGPVMRESHALCVKITHRSRSLGGEARWFVRGFGDETTGIRCAFESGRDLQDRGLAHGGAVGRMADSEPLRSCEADPSDCSERY